MAASDDSPWPDEGTVKKITLVIVEDNALLRAGLRALLAQDPGIEVRGEYDNGGDAVQAIFLDPPALVLMDLAMPGMSGVEATIDIKRRCPEVRVLVLSLHQGDEYVQASLRAGADGYVLKDATCEELRLAIRNVLGGKRYLSPDLSAQLIHIYLGGNGSPPDGLWGSLTHREREVLKLVAEGRPNKHIASYLSLSVKTVEKHRGNLMKKLGLHNAATLTAYAISKGLLQTVQRETSSKQM